MFEKLTNDLVGWIVGHLLYIHTYVHTYVHVSKTPHYIRLYNYETSGRVSPLWLANFTKDVTAIIHSHSGQDPFVSLLCRTVRQHVVSAVCCIVAR